MSQTKSHDKLISLNLRRNQPDIEPSPERSHHASTDNKNQARSQDISVDLKRKHPESESRPQGGSLSASSIPAPSKKQPRFPVKKICLSLPSKSLSDNTKKEASKLQPVSGDVAKVFGQDEESEEEEEMPIEARIRMRNKGRETPTSSGPNSFGKSRFGFIDRRALLNKQLEALNEEVSGDNEDRCAGR